MKQEIVPEDFRSLIKETVTEILEQQASTEKKVPDKLCFREHEAADLLSLPWHSLRDLRGQGKIKGYRLGSRIMYKREELQDLLDGSEV